MNYYQYPSDIQSIIKDYLNGKVVNYLQRFFNKYGKKHKGIEITSHSIKYKNIMYEIDSIYDFLKIPKEIINFMPRLDYDLKFLKYQDVEEEEWSDYEEFPICFCCRAKYCNSDLAYNNFLEKKVCQSCMLDLEY